MITAEAIGKVNSEMQFIDVKGNAYAKVNERIKAFRKICPNGAITTEIISLENGVVTMKSTVYDEDGKILGTGLAQEKESSSFINRTSYIENCESSSVGRALGMCGIGLEDSIASTEELANAINNQTKPQTYERKPTEYANEVERKTFFQRCKELGVESTSIMKQAGWKDGKMTVEHHGKALIILKEIEDARKGA